MRKLILSVFVVLIFAVGITLLCNTNNNTKSENEVRIQPLVKGDLAVVTTLNLSNNNFDSIGKIQLFESFGTDFKMRPLIEEEVGPTRVGVLIPNNSPQQIWIVENPIFEPYKKEILVFGIVFLDESEKDYEPVSANDTYVVFINTQGQLVAKEIHPKAGEEKTVPYGSLSRRDKNNQMSVHRF